MEEFYLKQLDRWRNRDDEVARLMVKYIQSKLDHYRKYGPRYTGNTEVFTYTIEPINITLPGDLW